MGGMSQKTCQERGVMMPQLAAGRPLQEELVLP